MKNQGCTIYKKDQQDLRSEWAHYKEGEVFYGTGFAKRISPINSKNEFDGDFEMVYTDQNENETPKIDLNIRYEITHYKLMWSINGKLVDEGIGIESDECLIIGYKAT